MAKSRAYYERKINIASERLDLYLKAEKAILDGAQSYTIANRQVNRGSLAEIRKMIEILEDEIAKLELLRDGRKTRKAIAVIPRDF